MLSYPWFRTLLHILVSIALILESVPAHPASSAATESFNTATASIAPGSRFPRSASSPLLSEARQLVSEQLARAEPRSVTLDKVLPPGTVLPTKPYVTYLPMLAKSGAIAPLAAAWEQLIYPRGSGFEYTGLGGWVLIRTQNAVYCSTDGNNVIYTRTRTPPYTNDVDWARWRPTIPQNGWYEVWVYIPSYSHGMSVTSQARYWINHANGQTLRIIDQNVNCQWVYLGTYRFLAGTSGNVYMGDYTGDNPQKLIAADGMLFRSVAANPRITSGINASPATQGQGSSVTASFTVSNYQASENITMNVRAYATKTGGGAAVDFGSVPCTMTAEGSCSYGPRSQGFNDLGIYSVCAQMSIAGGAWQNIPPVDNSAQSCQTVNIVTPADVRLSSSLTITPTTLSSPGGPATANFTVKNYGQMPATERFRAHASNGTVTFAETNAIPLNSGSVYSYTNTQTFSQVGVYEISAEHLKQSTWDPLLGNNIGHVRVMADPPAEDYVYKGTPPENKFKGDPVNTATGNYVHQVTDMGDPTPGLTMEVNRWYNALTAPNDIGPFGHGSSWLYGITVTWRNDKTALVRMADGHLAYFVGDVDALNPLDMSGLYHSQDWAEADLERAADGSAMLTTTDQTVYYFDVAGRLTHISHPYPAEINLVYTAGKLTQIVHSAGVVYTLAYTGNFVSSIASSTGRSVSYAYNAAGDLEMVTRPDGSTFAHTYDNHRLTQTITPNGNTQLRNVYDAQGRVVTQYDQAGRVSYFAYDVVLSGYAPVGITGATTDVYTDTLGNVTIHVYDDQHRIVQEMDALGYAISYMYDANNNVIKKVDQNGHTWNYTYDERKNELSETDPLGNTWYYTYDERNNQTSITNPLGYTWTYTYNADNHLLSETDPLGYTHQYTYDARGNLIFERDEIGAETRYAYNDLGLRTVITDTLRYVTYIEYDAWGNQTRYTDANGHVATFTYDAMNRMSDSTDPLGITTTLHYDPYGMLLTAVISDAQETYGYDGYDRLITQTNRLGDTTCYEYDALGRMIRSTNANGAVTTYTYDAKGNLVAQRDASGAITHMEYDPVGNLVRQIDALGRITEYVYDAANRQIEAHAPCNSCPGGFAVSYMVYDAAGQVVQTTDGRGANTTISYDPLGRVATTTDAYGGVQSYTYNAAGQTIQEVDPAGAVTRYEYDLLGHLIKIINPLGYQAVNVHDGVGNLVQKIDERGGVTAYNFDANDRWVSTVDALGNVSYNSYDAEGRLISTTDPLGHVITNQYDVNGNLISVTDPNGHTSRIEYDAHGQPVRNIDALGNISTITYDLNGRMVAEINPLGYTTVYTYNVVGNQIAERSPLGYITTFTYDLANNLSQRTEPTGAVWQFGYDANGNQVSQTDPLGNIQVTVYDLLNRPIQVTDALGGITHTQYDAIGRVISQTDSRGAVTRYEYDALGRQTRQVDALGHARVSTYDAASNLLMLQDERGFVTSYVYDALNRQIAETDPLGHTRYTLYNAAGQVRAEIDYNGNVTQYSYDAAGNRLQVIDPLGNITATAYDPLNRPVSATDALGNVSTITYNTLGQVIAETSPSGAVAAYTYDAEGRQTGRTDALGSLWLTEYDSAGRIARQSDPLGRVQIISYDAVGRKIAETDALNRTTQYTYDPLSRLLSVIAPDGTTQRYTYDPAGNVLSDQDGNGHVIRYEYDLLGCLLRKTDPLGRTWFYQYDAVGNQTGLATPTGQIVAQSYDALGRLAAKAYDGVQQLSLAYDANGNRTVMTDTVGVTTYVYDTLNRLVGSTEPAGHNVQYAYDAAGRQTSITYPDGATACYAYDADGGLISIIAPDDGVTAYTRDALGRETLVVQANGVRVATTYDATGNIIRVTQSDFSGMVFAQQTFTLDAANRRIAEVELLSQEAITTTYGYDALDRLVSSVSSDGVQTSYTFDSAGNRLMQAGVRLHNGALENYTRSFVYNAANQLRGYTDSIAGQTTYTYDANGSRTGMQSPTQRASYAYDAESRMVEARLYELTGGSWLPKSGIYERYAYDGDGQRVRQETLNAADNTPTYQRVTLYDNTSQWNVLQTYETGDTPAETRFLNAGALHKLAYWKGSASGYLQDDALGSVLGATDIGGNLTTASLMRYGDYGEGIAGDEPPTPDGFTGYERDMYAGLDYARNRYYDPSTGLFLTHDPFPVNRQDVLDLHRYLYVQADPANKTDPLGLKYNCYGNCEWWGSWTTSGDNQTLYLYLSDEWTWALRSGGGDGSWPANEVYDTIKNRASFSKESIAYYFNKVAGNAGFLNTNPSLRSAENVDFTVLRTTGNEMWIRPWGSKADNGKWIHITWSPPQNPQPPDNGCGSKCNIPTPTPSQPPYDAYKGMAEQISWEGSDGNYPRLSKTGNCTWYAAAAVKYASKGKIDLNNKNFINGWGNASEWVANANSYKKDHPEGFVEGVDQEPRAGDVAFIPSNHVAFVESARYENGKWIVVYSEEGASGTHTTYAGEKGLEQITLNGNKVKRWRVTQEVPKFTKTWFIHFRYNK